MTNLPGARRYRQRARVVGCSIDRRATSSAVLRRSPFAVDHCAPPLPHLPFYQSKLDDQQDSVGSETDQDEEGYEDEGMYEDEEVDEEEADDADDAEDNDDADQSANIEFDEAVLKQAMDHFRAHAHLALHSLRSTVAQGVREVRRIGDLQEDEYEAVKVVRHIARTRGWATYLVQVRATWKGLRRLSPDRDSPASFQWLLQHLSPSSDKFYDHFSLETVSVIDTDEKGTPVVPSVPPLSPDDDPRNPIDIFAAESIESTMNYLIFPLSPDSEVSRGFDSKGEEWVEQTWLRPVCPSRLHEPISYPE